ncbi:UNVERIFIED_CONTAM: hypothetical protein GTU68_023477 [Idotea baltica]|nr:hypothetical protein [Idotea baltica]
MQSKTEAERNADPSQTGDHTAYELQLVLLAEHKRQLKGIQSIERKVELKRELLPAHAAYLSGILEADKGSNDEVVTTCLLWLLDTGEYIAALVLAEYCIRHNLATPDAHQRTMGTMIAEEVADGYLKSEPVSLEVLEQVQALTAEQDMPDQVRAKLLKALGYQLREKGDLSGALEYLERALKLNDKAGVKKDIERLEREIKKAKDPDAKNQIPDGDGKEANEQEGEKSPPTDDNKQGTEQQGQT